MSKFSCLSLFFGRLKGRQQILFLLLNEFNPSHPDPGQREKKN